jgi:hypothetical protein
LIDLIKGRLAEGFDDPDDIIEAAKQYMEEVEETEVSTAVVRAAMRSVLADREAAMRTWPAVTDCDRLDAAFEALNARGIMARHNWTCCNNCGRAEMPEEFMRLHGEWEGNPIIGYVFYHNQGTEAAVQGSGLYLSFGSTQHADSEAKYIEQCLEIARTAIEALNAQGLKTTWDGTYAQRPHIALKWQRRTPPPRFVGDPSVFYEENHE